MGLVPIPASELVHVVYFVLACFVAMCFLWKRMDKPMFCDGVMPAVAVVAIAGLGSTLVVAIEVLSW